MKRVAESGMAVLYLMWHIVSGNQFIERVRVFGMCTSFFEFDD